MVKIVKNPGNGRLSNLNDPVLNVLRNTGITDCTTRLHIVGSFYEIYITMHGSMNIKLKYYISEDVQSIRMCGHLHRGACNITCVLL